MAVKKREWTTPKGENRIAWVAETFHYKDGKQQRAIKTFRTKKEADAYAAQTKVNIAAGIHVPDSASVTVKQAAADWLAAAEEHELGALDAGSVPAARRPAHRPVHRLGEAVEAHHQGGPRLREQAAGGGPIRGDGRRRC